MSAFISWLIQVVVTVLLALFLQWLDGVLGNPVDFDPGVFGALVLAFILYFTVAFVLAAVKRP